MKFMLSLKYVLVQFTDGGGKALCSLCNTVAPLLRDHFKNKKWSLKRGGLILEVHSTDLVVT